LADRSPIGTAPSRDVGWRAALFVFLLAGIFWLGTSAGRGIIGNHLLRPGTLQFDEYLAPEAQREIFRLLSLTSLVVMVCYVATLVSSIIFLWLSPLRLKEHGWLMLSAILFYLFVPVETYTLFLDGRMIYEEFFATSDNSVFRELFMQRLTALAGAPMIATFCYITIIGIVAFQPLRRRAEGS